MKIVKTNSIAIQKEKQSWFGALFYTSIRKKILLIISVLLLIVLGIVLLAIWSTETLSILTCMTAMERTHSVTLNNAKSDYFIYLSTGNKILYEQFNQKINKSISYAATFGSFRELLKEKSFKELRTFLLPILVELNDKSVDVFISRLSLLIWHPLVVSLIETAASAGKLEVSFKEMVAALDIETEQSARSKILQNLVDLDMKITDMENKFAGELKALDDFVVFLINTALIVFFILCAASGFLISFRISLTIALPISHVVEDLKNLSQGDFSNPVVKSSFDEIGRIAEYTENVRISLGKIIGQIKHHSSESNNSLRSLSEVMTHSKKSAAQINDDASHVKELILDQSTVVAEVSSTIEEIARIIENQDLKINSQSASVTQSSTAIQQMIANIKSIGNNLNASSKEFDNLQNVVNIGNTSLGELKEMITALSKQSDSVMEANNTIKNIASQTNLLAMNAAIEAAHAGESGKGFSVVADEIRKLAEVSEQQSKVISENLGQLKKSIESAVIISEETGHSFDTIVKSVRLVTNLEREIKNALDEQATGSSQVLGALSSISQITSEVDTGSNEMLAGSKAIIKEITGLVDITEKVKDHAVNVANKAEDVKTIIDQSITLLNTNIESIKKMDEQESLFKIKKAGH